MTGCGIRTHQSQVEYIQKAEGKFAVSEKTISVDVRADGVEFSKLKSYCVLDGFRLVDYPQAELKVNIVIEPMVVQTGKVQTAIASTGGGNNSGQFYWLDSKCTRVGLFQVFDKSGSEVLRAPISISDDINYGFRVIQNVPMGGSFYLKDMGSEKAYFTVADLNAALRLNWNAIITAVDERAVRTVQQVFDQEFKEKIQDTKKVAYVQFVDLNEIPGLEIPPGPVSAVTDGQLQSRIKNYESTVSSGYKKPDGSPMDAEIIDAVKFNLAYLYFVVGNVNRANDLMGEMSSANNTPNKCKSDLLYAIHVSGGKIVKK